MFTEYIKRPAVITLALGFLSFLITEIVRFPDAGPLREFRRFNNASFIEPLEIVALTLVVLGIWLCFLQIETQKRWWRMARWFFLLITLLLGYSLTVPYQGSGFIAFPGVREITFLWAFILMFVTLIATFSNRL